MDTLLTRSRRLLARQDDTWNVDVRLTMGELVARVAALEAALGKVRDYCEPVKLAGPRAAAELARELLEPGT